MFRYKFVKLDFLNLFHKLHLLIPLLDQTEFLYFQLNIFHDILPFYNLEDRHRNF